MADHNINININHTFNSPSGGITGGSTSDISRQLEDFTKVSEQIKDLVSNVTKVSEDSSVSLAEKMSAITVALQSVSKSTNDSFSQGGYSRYLEATSEFEASKGIYSSSKSSYAAKASASYDQLMSKNIKNFEDFAKVSEEATRQVNQLSNNMRLANREINESRNTKWNAFNISELLMAVAGRAGTAYMTAGIGYQQALVGANPSQLAGLQVGTDIAQRNAISSGVQAALPAIGFAIGSALGSPLLGGAIGYAATLPISAYMAMQNAQEQAKLSVQMQGATVGLFGGGGGTGTVTSGGETLFGHRFFLSPGTYHDDRYQTTSLISSLVNRGLPTGAAVGMSLASQRYFGKGLSSNDAFIPYLSAYVAETGDDPNSLASTVYFLASKTGKSPMDIFSSLGGIGKKMGQTAGQVAPLVAMLSAQSNFRTYDQVANFVANTAQYGTAYQSTAAGYSTAGFQQQIAENVVGGAFGVNVPALMGQGSAQQIKEAHEAFMHFYNNPAFQGKIGGVKESDILAQVMLGGSVNANTIINAGTGRAGTGGIQPLTPQQVQQNAPSAYTQAINNAQINATGKVTILTSNIYLPGLPGSGGLRGLSR